MINHIIGGGLLLSPFIFRESFGASNIRLSKDIFLYLCIIILVFFYKKAKEMENIDRDALIVLIVLLFINSYEFLTNRFWLQFQMASSFILLFYLLATSNLNAKIIKKYIVVFCILESIWIVLSMTGFNYYNIISSLMDMAPLSDTYEYTRQAIGSLNNPNMSGALLAVSLPLFFSRKLIIFSIIPIAAIIIGGSSLPIITAISAIIYFAWVKLTGNKIIPYFVLFAFGFYFLYIGLPDNGFFSGGTRYEAWVKSIEFYNNLLLGNGMGWTGDFFKRVAITSGEHFAQLHNEYLQAFLELGLIGLSLIGFIWYRCIQRCKDPIALSSIFAIAINSYGNFYFHISVLAFVAVIIFAVSYNKEGFE